MRLVFTPAQQELGDAVAHFCQQQVTAERLAAWQADTRVINGTCWRAVADLGWFGLGIPEARGGMGLGLVEVACLLQECARGLIPRSVIGGIHGAWALARLDPEAEELAAVARGERTVAIALDEEHGRDPQRYETRADRQADQMRLTGSKFYVANGLEADYQIVAAREGGGVSLFLVGRENVTAELLQAFDGEAQAVLRYAGAPPLRRLGRTEEGAAAQRRLCREQTALALAEMVGGMQAALDMTVAYVKEREQFGQKLAVFQAVQHQVADMATAYTASRHLAWQAICRLARQTEQGTELEAAAAFAGQAFKQITLTAHHLHGGAGYVLEHPLHYHAERAQTLCIRHAPEAWALAAVARELLD